MLDDFFVVILRYFVRIGYQEYFQGHRRGVTRKVIVVGKAPLDAFYRESPHCHPMPITDMLRVVGNHLDARFAIREGDDCDGAGLMDDGLRALLVGEAMGDGDVTVALGVDTRHVLAEEPAVGGGVAKLVDGDVVMDHLMENGVLDKGFRQVNTDVDTQDEIFVAVTREETLLAASEGDFAQKAFGVGEFNGNRRKLPTKETGIVLVKTGLYVWDGGDQLQFLALKGTIISQCTMHIILI